MNKITINSYILYGCYAWCGNNYNSQKSGEYLCPKVSDDQRFHGSAKYQLMLKVYVRMLPEIYKFTDVIYVYDNQNKLLQYSKIIMENQYTFLFPIKSELMGSTCKMKFKKAIGVDQSPLKSTIFETIYEENFVVPYIAIVNEEICAFCLDIVKDNKLLTECHHTFHMHCIWNYFEFNNLLETIDEQCILFGCKHDKKIKKFKCPTCRKEIDC